MRPAVCFEDRKLPLCRVVGGGACSEVPAPPGLLIDAHRWLLLAIAWQNKKVHTWIIQSLQPCSSRGIQQFYLQAQRETQTRTIWRNTQLQCALDLCILKVSYRSLDFGARGRAQGEPPPLRPTSGVPTVALKMGWTGRTMTRPLTGTPRACGARTSSRASRRPSPYTPPVAGGKSSCQMRERCMSQNLLFVFYR
ncbi:hypothetical protein NQZ68_003477 [Dissostichus eleginoides]|nr:hypothetical protein NQZ68_003477 [Dissostichus eleginoides]